MTLNVYDICVPPRINTLSEKRVCHKMSIFIQPGACSARYWLVSAQQSWPIRSKNTEKGLTFTGALIYYRLLVKTCCQNNAVESHKSGQNNAIESHKSGQNNAIESHKSVISVTKIRGFAIFFISVCISVWASCGILWLCIDWSKTENMWKK